MTFKLSALKKPIFSLPAKLLALAISLVILLAAAGVLLQATLDDNARIIGSQTAIIQALTDIGTANENFSELRWSYLTFLSQPNGQTRKAAEEKMQAFRASLEKFAAVPATDKRRALEENLTTLRSIADQAEDKRLREPQRDALQASAMRTLAGSEDLLEGLGDDLKALLSKSSADTLQKTTSLKKIPTVFIIGGLATMAIVMLMAVYSIFMPVSRLTRAMTSASQDTQNAHSYSLRMDKNDELGKAASALNLLLREVSSGIEKNKDIENQLQETGRYLKAITDNMIDGIVIVDRHGKIESFSPGAEEILGYAHREVLGTAFSKLGSSDTAHWPKISAQLESGKAHTKADVPHEVRLTHKSGHTVPVELLIGKAVYGDSPMNIITVRDISVRKQMETLLGQAQRMETIGRMSGGIAHDFNNMLIVISGNLELIRRRVEDREELLEMIDDALKSVDRGKDLTQRILAFSRKQILNPATFNLNDKLPDVIELMRRAVREDVQVKTRLADELWHVNIDAAQLESALLNLAINARDAIDGSGGRIVIETENISFEDRKMAPVYDMPPGDYVSISVTDNGSGIPPEVIDRVFDPFFTTKDVDKGTGLGLSMVYGFTRQSNGHILITSNPGNGTSVRLFFPRSLQKEVSLTEPADEATVVENNNNESIMVVEDRPDVLKYLTTTLREMGYRVTPAKDAHSALSRLKNRKQLDLLITDVVMPGKMNGEQLAKEVKKKLPDTGVLFISGYTADALVNQGALKKGVHLLKKPFTRRDLAIHIRNALKNRA